jgi:DNA repair ATPase RecN
MGLIDAATAPLRYVLYGAEHEADALRDLSRLEAHVAAAVDAIRETTGQVEAHVEVIEKLAASLIPLTAAMAELSAQMPALVESVGSLNRNLTVIDEVLEPLAQAQQDLAHAEHEVTKLGSLFSRHRTTPQTPDS